MNLRYLIEHGGKSFVIYAANGDAADRYYREMLEVPPGELVVTRLDPASPLNPSTPAKPPAPFLIAGGDPNWKPREPDLTVPPREFRVTKRQALGKQKPGQPRPTKANP